MKIYLAGGFKSGWQEVVKSRLPNLDFFDPSKNGFSDPKLYTFFDLQGLKECDLIFANLEDSNPAGYSLALEVGFSKALGKPIVFISDIPENQDRRKYLGMLQEIADFNFYDLAKGIEFLDRIHKAQNLCNE